jgi:putative ATP-dependent endonuclease of OLD family
MVISRILIENYKLIKRTSFEVSPDLNIFVGENDSGKSTLLEVIGILTTGRINGNSFERELKTSMFNKAVRDEYVNAVKVWKDACNKNTVAYPTPPEIIMEAYFMLDSESALLKGTNNSLREDSPGIRIHVHFDSIYEHALSGTHETDEVYDIPVEFYKVEFFYFSGTAVGKFRNSPINAVFIDTTRKDYSRTLSKFVSESISSCLSQEDRTNLSTVYRNNRNSFQASSVVTALNSDMRIRNYFDEKVISIALKEENINEWQYQMSIQLDDIPFENIGFGSQNMAKIMMAVKNSRTQANIVLMEEPENNLSHTNMAKLISYISSSRDKQLFISTHSSYVANKLALNKLLLVRAGNVTAFSTLNDETIKYFQKLPGYNTLRLVLAERVVLVEGPTEELILQRAYLDKYGVLPQDEGIDIITICGLAFKRYCDIAMIMNKPIIIVTDNDGSIEKNIKEKYYGYIGSELFTFCYESDEKLNTLEKTVLNANIQDGAVTDVFWSVLGWDKAKRFQIENQNTKRALDYMLKNKTEWAVKVLESENKINYPEYIIKALESSKH